MDLDTLDVYLVFDLFILLLIGMGPKIALVPFLELTEGMEAKIQRQVADRMVRTAVGTALLLVALGWLLMRLLHFSPGAASVAGGIVLLLLALNMLVGPSKHHHHDEAEERDPMQMALYPLGVPYLLNPAGIATLVITSSEINSVLYAVIVVGLVLLVGAFDFAIFRNMDRLAQHLDPSRLVVTEAVFGVLLSALAVQLFVDGLADLGIIAAVAH